MKNRSFFFGALLVSFLLIAAGVNAQVSPNDGGHWFSTDGDTALNPVSGSNGDVYHTPEDTTNEWSWNIPNLGDQEIDALSSHTHDNVSLYTTENLHGMYNGDVYINYSVDLSSDIYEFKVPDPINPGFIIPDANDGDLLTPYSHAPSYLGPRTNSDSWIHDTADVLGLDGYDLDALESDRHIDPYQHPFLNHGGIVNSVVDDNAYFSVEGTGSLDNGDVYVQNPTVDGRWPDAMDGPPYTDLNGASYSLYVDDISIAASEYFSMLGFDADVEQIDALVVFDVSQSSNSFDAANTLYGSDAIFFSLAPNATGLDAVGDNIYWYSAYDGGTGGLYLDPESLVNFDALAVHAPEPVSSTLFLIGAATLGFRRYRRIKIA